MTQHDIIRWLEAHDACEPAVEWVRAGLAEGKTPYDLWRTCEHGDWLVWLVEELDVWPSPRVAREFVADCAAHVLHIFEVARPDDDRPRKTIEVARRYARGEATVDEMHAAARAAAHAARCDKAVRTYADRAATAAALAASFAAHVAWADIAVDYAATAVDYAATAAARAATAVDYAATAAARAAYAANAAERRWQARRLRRVVPWRDVRAALEET